MLSKTPSGTIGFAFAGFGILISFFFGDFGDAAFSIGVSGTSGLVSKTIMTSFGSAATAALTARTVLVWSTIRPLTVTTSQPGCTPNSSACDPGLTLKTEAPFQNIPMLPSRNVILRTLSATCASSASSTGSGDRSDGVGGRTGVPAGASTAGVVVTGAGSGFGAGVVVAISGAWNINLLPPM